MLIKIVVKNMGIGPRVFRCHVFTRVGPKKLEKVTTLEANSSTEPGAIYSTEFNWDSEWSLSPKDVLWKAPPEDSAVWQVIQWSWGGEDLLVRPKDGSLPMLA